MKGKNVFITGINGFVGTACAKAFVASGANVIGLVREDNRKTDRWVADNCTIVRGDITNTNEITYALSHYEVDYVLHLASQAIVRICHDDPYTAYSTNVMGLVSLLESCRRLSLGVEKILVMTSDKYYGFGNDVPYTEDLPPMVGDTYSTSKSCQDMIARSFSFTYGLPVIVVRSGNIYGPGDLNFSRLIPRSSVKLINGLSPVLYEQAMSMVRDFVYVDDVISAFKLLFVEGVNGEAYNIGTGKPVEIKDVVDALVNLIDPRIEVEIKKSDIVEISEQYLDAGKLRSLGWRPSLSLYDGLRKTVSYYKQYVVDTGAAIK